VKNLKDYDCTIGDISLCSIWQKSILGNMNYKNQTESCYRHRAGKKYGVDLIVRKGEFILNIYITYIIII